MADRDTDPVLEKEPETTPVDERRMGVADAREGLPTGEYHQPSEAETKARGRRNIAIALSVLAFVVLVYLTTFFRLAENLQAGAAG